MTGSAEQSEVLCPICGSSEFGPNGLTVSLREVLHRWREEAHIAVFTDEFIDRNSRHAERLSLANCRYCGFGRFEPPVAGDSEFYEGIVSGEYYMDDKWEFHVAASALEKRKPNRLLDVGAGSGHFLQFIRARAPDISLHGYEFSTNGRETLRGKGFQVIEALPDTPRPDEQFDAITLFQVLEHVPDPVDLLTRLSCLLSPGGTLILTTPDAEGPIQHFPHALTELPPHHVTKWTERSFRKGLPRFGLSVDAIRHEPLPSYLWPAYLPFMWSEQIWPALRFGTMAGRNPELDPMAPVRVAEIVGAMNALREAGVMWLGGVRGHTLYASATKNNVVERAGAAVQAAGQ